MNIPADQKELFETLLAINGQSVDWYLQKLISLANINNMEMGITVIIGGSVISGTLISGKKYFERFADDFSSAWPLEGRDVIRESFASHGKIYDFDEGEDNIPGPEYIHLDNAKIVQSSRIIPSQNGLLWRGRINAISGFSLGILS